MMLIRTDLIILNPKLNYPIAFLTTLMRFYLNYIHFIFYLNLRFIKESKVWIFIN